MQEVCSRKWFRFVTLYKVSKHVLMLCTSSIDLSTGRQERCCHCIIGFASYHTKCSSQQMLCLLRIFIVLLLPQQSLAIHLPNLVFIYTHGISNHSTDPLLKTPCLLFADGLLVHDVHFLRCVLNPLSAS